jgi:hypothetical protein
MPSYTLCDYSYNREYGRLLSAWTAHYEAKGVSPHRARNIAHDRCQRKRTYPQGHPQ